MPSARNPSSSRGFTMVELIVSMAITVVLVALSTRVLVSLDRDQLLRKQVSELQGGARLALGFMESDLRQSALSASTGVIWTANSSGTAPVARPAVQVFAAVPGGGNLDVKPGTDAVLVVQALSTPRAATRVTLNNSKVGIPVTSGTGGPFDVNQPLLIGDYGDASWGVADLVTPDGSNYSITLADKTVNVFPAYQDTLLGAGASVRPAQARLYYVDTKDELVRLTLNVPRAPKDNTEVRWREVLGVGFENLQLDCQIVTGTGGLQACRANLSGDSSIGTESEAAFGTLSTAAGQGALLTSSNVNQLRSVLVNVSAHSKLYVNPSQNDPPIGLVTSAGTSTLGDTIHSYARRAYQVSAGVRNTSLGVF